jgi:peptide/nickel transport system substrate-binding protein
MVPAMATLGDVARHAGVSVASVSRALNHPAKVSPEMRKRVTSAMAELGDVRDGAARAGLAPLLHDWQLLAEAGYAEGFEIAALSYGGTIRRETEAAVGDLRAIGIEAAPQFLQPTPVRQKMADGQARLFRMHWGLDSVNDAIRWAGQFFDESPDDMAHDDEVTALLRKGVSVADPEQRKAFYKQALQKVARDVSWIPITTFVTNCAFTRDLDFKPSVDEYPRFYTATWK